MHVNLINYKTWLINQLIYHKGLIHFWPINDPNVQLPTSINATLPPLEKAQLISLLKEYIDVFAWEYHEMPGLDPNLVAHALNVELGAKPVV